MHAPTGVAPSRTPIRHRLKPLIFLFVLVPQTLVVLVQAPAPVLLRDAPLVLLALHPFEPWALLVSPKVDVVAFVTIIVAVRAVAYFGDYFLGRWYGERGLAWLKGRQRTTRVAVLLERLFVRWGALLVVVYPGAIVSVLAGATRMRLRTFAPLVLLGLFLWATLLRVVAGAAGEPLIEVVTFVERYALWLAVPLAVFVLVLVVRERRSLRSLPRVEPGLPPSVIVLPSTREAATVGAAEDGRRATTGAGKRGERQPADHESAGGHSREQR